MHRQRVWQHTRGEALKRSEAVHGDTAQPSVVSLVAHVKGSMGGARFIFGGALANGLCARRRALDVHKIPWRQVIAIISKSRSMHGIHATAF